MYITHFPKFTMIPKQMSSFKGEPRYLSGIEDSIEFISTICSSYLDVERETIYTFLKRNYKEVLETFVCDDEANQAIFVVFEGNINSSEGDDNRVCDIRVSLGAAEQKSQTGNSVGFYKCYSGLKDCENGGNRDPNASENLPRCNFILMPIFFNDEYPLVSSFQRYLNDLVLPMYKREIKTMHKSEPSRTKYRCILQKLNEVATILDEININMSTSDVFGGNSPMKPGELPEICTDNNEKRVTYEGGMENVTSNVSEWSFEFVNTIKRYLTTLTVDNYEENAAKALTSSDESSSVTSSDSTPYGSEISSSLIDYANSKIRDMETDESVECTEVNTSDDEFSRCESRTNKINKYVEELETGWNDFDIEVSYDTKEVLLNDGVKELKIYFIGNLDHILTFIQVNSTKLNVIKTANSSDIYGDITNWEMKLSRVKSFVDNYIDFKNTYKKLVEIAASKCVQFQEYLDDLYSLDVNFKSVSTLGTFVDIDDNKMSLLLTMIEDVRKIGIGIKRHLNDIRYTCPRLYFIQDSDLIEIIGGRNIGDYLCKMFPGISSLIITQNLVSGIQSAEGEELIFDSSIKYETGENIDFIKKLEISIKTSIKKSFVDSLERLDSFYSSCNLDGKSLNEWIKAFPLQVLLLSMSICWTKSMESSVVLGNADLEVFLSKLMKFIIININRVNGAVKFKMYQLFLSLNYQLNKMKYVETESKYSVKWLKCVRCYCNDDEIKIKILSQVYTYSYEYLFNVQKMIVTDVTDRFYTFASLVLNCNLLPSAQGPAGTGKTETIKSLSYLTGSNVLVFNFSELYEVEDVERILAGLCIMGYWGIFDEFNRLNECVLSSVTETVGRICNKENDTIVLMDKKIKINRNSAYFITMNPGYTGRSQLPLNCIYLCQPFIMEHVDLSAIIDANLRVNDFKNVLGVNKKIIFVLNSFKLIFTKRKFDFGLRFVKCIFKFVTHLKQNESLGKEDNCSDEVVFIQSLLRLLYPRLLEDEIPLCQRVVSYDGEVIYSSKESKFITICKRLDLEGDLFHKVFQLYEMYIISSSTILVGESGSGKSYVFNNFVECLGLIKNVEVVAFDPNSVEIRELYGYKDDDKWIEGLIPYIFKSNVDKETLIVLDGHMKQEWVENLNSLLDDNKILTLSNGERIPLGDNMRIFFETDTLEDITPATVSRNTLVVFEARKLPIGNECNIRSDDNSGHSEKINSMINDSKSFVIKHRVCSGVTTLIKEMAENCVVYSIYLSEFVSSSEFMNWLLSICNFSDNDWSIKPALDIKLVILVKDIYVLDFNRASSLNGILRQIIGYKFFYRYSIKASRWDKIFVENIVFVFLQPSDTEPKCRLLSMLPAITLNNGTKNCGDIAKLECKIVERYAKHLFTHDLSIIKSMGSKEYEGWFAYKLLQMRFEDKSPELKELVGNVFEIKTDIKCADDGLILRCKSIDEAYNFICIYLLNNKGFLCLSGPRTSGKRFLSKIACSNLGIELIDLNQKTIDEITVCFVESGTSSKKYAIYIGLDLLFVTNPKLYFIVKNMMCNNYSIMFSEDKLKDIKTKCANDSSFEEFKHEFNRNINENVRFILVGNEIESTMLNRGIVYRMEPLEYDEFVAVANINLDGLGLGDVIAELYSKCKQMIGYRLADFLFIVKMTRHWYDQSKKSNSKAMKRLKRGFKKIESFKNDVNDLEKSLNSTKDKFDAMNVESELRIRELEEKKAECEKRKAVAIQLTETLEGKRRELEIKKNKIKSDIEHITPLIVKAKEEVENINRKALEELKTMRTPPSIVKYTIETVAVVLKNNKNVQWEDAKKVLKSPDFISNIVSYDIETMSEKTYEILKSRIETPEWDVKRIFKASRAAGPLAEWVESISSCYQIYKQIIPLKNEVELIEKETRKNETKLAKQNKLISELEKDMEKNRNDYDKSIEESKLTVAQIEMIQSKLNVSKIILSTLTNELLRWEVKIEEIKKDDGSVLGNSIIEAIMPIYISLDHRERKLLQSECDEILKDNSLNCSLEIERISNIEKYIIERNSKFKHVLILDGYESEYSALIKGTFTEVSACDDVFLQVLESVKMLSGALVVTDIHCCSTSSKVAILNEFSDKVDNETDFNMYIISTNEYFKANVEGDHYVIESIYNMAFVINMKLTPESFRHFAENKLIQILEPEIYSSFINNNKNVSKLENKIKENENLLLERLIDSDIFDPGFIEFMDRYKQTTLELDSELFALKKLDEIYYEAVELKDKLIQVICRIYTEVDKLVVVNKIYSFDASILFYFANILRHEDSCLSDMIKVAYNWVVKGIFECDRMFWDTNILKLLSEYENDLKKQMNEEGNIDYKCQLEVKNLSDKHLNSSKYDNMILDYYETIVLMTDGFQDPVYIAQAICDDAGEKLDIYAVGSLSEMEKTKNLIIKSLAFGNPVLLKNIHLSKTWSNMVETDIMKMHGRGKLFLSCDKKADLSKNMLLYCHKVTCELSNLKGLLVNLFRIFESTLKDVANYCFVLMKCVFIYSVAFIRQLYVPYGWAANYNFNINDLKMTLNVAKEIYEGQLTDPVKRLYELNEMIVEIYSAKIAIPIDVKLLEDIVRLSDQKLQVESDFDLETWMDANPMDDDLAFVGFTKYTQCEIYSSKQPNKAALDEYDTSTIETEYGFSCRCVIIQSFINDEVSELRSWSPSHINPQVHKRNCESICTLVEGRADAFVDFNHVVSPNRLIELLKFPIAERNKADPSLMKLCITVGEVAGGMEESRCLPNDSIVTNAVLYNGSYVKATNSITTGECQMEHQLRFRWTEGDGGDESEQGDRYVPLYNSNGLVCGA